MRITSAKQLVLQGTRALSECTNLYHAHLCAWCLAQQGFGGSFAM